MTTFITYRNGTDELEKRIEAAMIHFQQQHGRLPAAVVVHKSEVDTARALTLALPVSGTGGCLVGEVWLQVPQAKAAGDGP